MNPGGKSGWGGYLFSPGKSRIISRLSLISLTGDERGADGDSPKSEECFLGCPCWLC